MGSAEEEPQLSLLSLPSNYKQQQQQQQKHAGMSTPPIHTLASVPFHWEEAPGRPRPCMTRPSPSSRTTAARCLELPPRLFEAKVSHNMPSPTTVLDGPYYSNVNNNSVGALVPPPPRTLSRSLSFGKGRSPFENLGGKASDKERMVFGSTRWGSSFRRSIKDVVVVEDGSDDRDVDECYYGHSKAKITRVKRRPSFFISFSSSRSHLLSSVYESFKQVVTWRRKQEEKFRR